MHPPPSQSHVLSAKADRSAKVCDTDARLSGIVKLYSVIQYLSGQSLDIRVLKMFSAKTSKMKGWCSVSSNMCVALHEKPAGEKSSQTRRGLPWHCNDIQSSQVDIHVSVTTPVNIRCCQDTLRIHFHHPYTWQPFHAARLCVPLCFIAHYTVTRWPSSQAKAWVFVRTL